MKKLQKDRQTRVRFIAGPTDLRARFESGQSEITPAISALSLNNELRCSLWYRISSGGILWKPFGVRFKANPVIDYSAGQVRWDYGMQRHSVW